LSQTRPDQGHKEMATISVRRAVSSDLTHIVRHYGPGDSPWDPFADLAKLQTIPLEGLIVAEVQGQYAGFLYWFAGENPWFDPRIDRYAHIVEVQVVERYRGQGVGKSLLIYALEQITEKSIAAIYVDTTEDTAVARRLYESAGFHPFSRTIHYRWEPDEDR
jgi:ribosomal protein S18 acetylase RimI-like enzyme